MFPFQQGNLYLQFVPSTLTSYLAFLSWVTIPPLTLSSPSEISPYGSSSCGIFSRRYTSVRPSSKWKHVSLQWYKIPLSGLGYQSTMRWNSSYWMSRYCEDWLLQTLRGLVTITISQVTVNSDVYKGNRKVLHPVEDYWANPWIWNY